MVESRSLSIVEAGRREAHDVTTLGGLGPGRTPAALRPTEQWRPLAAGSLHADPTHILAHALTLVIVGPVLERRLGAETFSLVYAASLVGAGVVSVSLHQGAVVGVGASGAIFGVLGALWTLGAEDLSPGFFLVNFALNAALASRHPHVDRAAHIGGFVTGMAMVALLDVASRVNLHWLRCKFPEFVKVGALVLLVACGVAVRSRPLLAAPWVDPRLVEASCGTAAALILVTSLDLLLSIRRGLAAVVPVFAAGNAALGWTAAGLLLPKLSQTCAAVESMGAIDGGMAGVFCPNLAMAPRAAAVLVGALTLLVLPGPLRRGLGDVGVIPATFMGNRRREHGWVRPTHHTRT